MNPLCPGVSQSPCGRLVHAAASYITVIKERPSAGRSELRDSKHLLCRGVLEQHADLRCNICVLIKCQKENQVIMTHYFSNILLIMGFLCGGTSVRITIRRCDRLPPEGLKFA